LSDPTLHISEVVEYTKKHFDEKTATEVSLMLYSLTQKNHTLDDEVSELIDGTVPAIKERDRLHQTFSLPHVGQFNNNPKIVINLPGVMSVKLLLKCKKKMKTLKLRLKRVT